MYEKRNKETKIQDWHIKRRRFGGREVGRFIKRSRGNRARQELLDEAILRLKTNMYQLYDFLFDQFLNNMVYSPPIY